MMPCSPLKEIGLLCNVSDYEKYRNTLESLIDKDEGKIVKKTVFKSEGDKLGFLSFDVRPSGKVLIYDGSDESYEVTCAEDEKLSFVVQMVLANGGYLFCDCDYMDMKNIIKTNPHFATTSFCLENGLGQKLYNWYCSLELKQESFSETMLLVIAKDPGTVYAKLINAGNDHDDFNFCCNICINDYAPEGETIIGIFY